MPWLDSAPFFPTTRHAYGLSLFRPNERRSLPATRHGLGMGGVRGFCLGAAPGCHREPAQPAAAQPEAEPEDHVALGQAYYREGDAARAVAEFSQAIAADPRAVNIYLERANAYLRLGRSQAAFADFDKAIELEPENPERYLSRAVADEQVERRLDAALADCKIARSPGSAASRPLSPLRWRRRSICSRLRRGDCRL